MGFPPNMGSAVSGGFWPDFSVNAAAVDGGYLDGSVILRTGAQANAPGAFNGGGTGNKAIFGLSSLNGRFLSEFTALKYVWENVDGPGGPFFLPPGGPSVQTPYANLVVDFDPNGAGDLRLLVVCDDSLNAAITNAIGTYANNGSNVLTYAWDDSMDVLIVGAPPAAVPGGVAPNVSVGGGWPENSYSFAELVAANPDSVIVSAFTGDGGLPAGAVTAGLLLVSGDSGNITRSSKRLTEVKVNGNDVL